MIPSPNCVSTLPFGLRTHINMFRSLKPLDTQLIHYTLYTMPPAVTTKAKITEEDATEMVFALMRRENRPFNAQLVQDNTAGKVKKVQAARILEKGVADGAFKAKDFGKNRVYWPDQGTPQPACPDQEAVFSRQMQQTAEDLGTTQATFRTLCENNAEMRRQMSDALLAAAVERLEAEIHTLKAAKEARVAEPTEPEARAAATHKNRNSGTLVKLKRGEAKAAKERIRRKKAADRLLTLVCGGCASEQDIHNTLGLQREPAHYSTPNSISC